MLTVFEVHKSKILAFWNHTNIFPFHRSYFIMFYALSSCNILFTSLFILFHSQITFSSFSSPKSPFFQFILSGWEHEHTHLCVHNALTFKFSPSFVFICFVKICKKWPDRFICCSTFLSFLSMMFVKGSLCLIFRLIIFRLQISGA